MAGNIKGITIEIGGDTQPLQNALKGVNKQAAESTKELKQIDKALKFDTGNVTLLTQKQEVLAKQVETTKEKLATLRQAQVQVEAQFKSGNIGAEQYRAFQREVETTQTVLKSYESKLEGVNQALSENGNRLSSTKSQWDSLKQEQARLASESEKLTSQFKLQESELSSNASESEKLALVQKKVNESSSLLEKQIQNLEKQLELTKAQYGENSIEANKLEQTLNDTKTAYNHLQNEMEEMGTSSTSAKDNLSEINHLLKADILMEFSDCLAELSQKLIDFGKQSLEAFNEVDEGMDIIVTKTGASGQALEEMTTIAKKLATEIPTDFNTAGSAVGELNTQFGLTGDSLKSATVEKIKNSTSETEKLTLASDIFGTKGAPRMVDAINRGALSFDDLAETAKKASGTVGSTYEATLDPIDKFTTAQNEAKLALAEVGDAIAVTFAPILEILADLLRSVAEWFSSLLTPVKQFIIIVGSLITGLGLLLPIFLALQAAALAMGVTIGGLIVSVAPIIAIVLGIIAVLALLIVGIKELWEHNKGFRTAVMDIWNAIYSFISTIIQEISDFILRIWGTLTSWRTENQDLILAAATTVWNAISTVITTVMSILEPYIQATLENIKLIISTAWEIIKQVVETAINLVLGIIKAIMQVITGDWSGAWETIKAVISTVWESIKSIVSLVLSTISQLISNTWNGIKNTISNLLSAISNVVSTIWNSISSTISGILNGISSTVSNVWNGVKNTISNAINTAKNAVSTAITAIKNLFNFRFQWSHIPLPHFSVSGSANPLDWLKGQIPRIGIEWYAKGGILTKPTAFGTIGNSLMVGGEAGNEAVLPLNESTLGAIGRGIARTMNLRMPDINISITGNIIREQADIEKIANEVASRIAEELARQKQLRGATI